MEYTYQSRQKLVEHFKERWNRKLILAGKKLKEQVKQVDQLGGYRPESTAIFDEAMELCKKEGYLTYSELMKKQYSKLSELYVGKKYLEDFYYIIDKLNQFPYTEGMYRRTVRTKHLLPQIGHVFILLNKYRVLQFYDCTIEEYLQNKLTEEKLDYKRSPAYGFSLSYLDDMIAARIDKKDEAVIATVRELILSENNTAVLTTDVIRGIVKSSDAQLHQLLADFLLAARLQEGVRQAVCENADCGTVEAFMKIFDTVCEHGLIRYAAVKRAIATWTGICDVENMDRISDKMLNLMQTVLKDREKAAELLETDDSIQISIGLWALGAHELQDALEVMENYLENGSRNQILTMAYFNRTLECPWFTSPVAKKAVKKFSGDNEILAAFMPTYLNRAQELAFQALNYNVNRNKTVKYYKDIQVRQLLDNEEEAREHYGIMKNTLESMKKKCLEFSPCIFPWYSVCVTKTQLIQRMCALAYALKDEALIEEMSEKLSLIDVSDNYSSRSTWVELLLHQPENARQKQQLLGYVADKESSTRELAFRIAEGLELEEADYQLLEGYLKYKTGDIRRNVLKLLGRQEDEMLERSVGRLLKSSNEGIRDGGLSLIIEAKNMGREEGLLSRLAQTASALTDTTDKEQILIGQITQGAETQKEEGGGLYDPSLTFTCPEYKTDSSFLTQFFTVSPKDFDRIVTRLIEYIEEHSQLEYKNSAGVETLLGNRLSMQQCDNTLSMADSYPFRELWEQFYEKEIKDAHLLKLLLLAWNNHISVYGGRIKNEKKLMDHAERLLGSTLCEYRVKQHPYTKDGYGNQAHTVLVILESLHKDTGIRKAALELAAAILNSIPEEDLWYEVEQDNSINYYGIRNEHYNVSDIPVLWHMLYLLTNWESDGEFAESFYALYQLDLKFDYMGHYKENPYSYNRKSKTWTTIYYYIKAYHLELIPRQLIFKAAFEILGLNAALSDLSRLVIDKRYPYDINCLKAFIAEAELEKEVLDENIPFVKIGREVYSQITDKILDVELKRGEMETEYSKYISSIRRIYGMERMISILKALGNDKLDRSAYYYWSSCRNGRKECLSYLLQICWPLKEDSAAKLKELLKGTKVKEQKIIETAMYAPQWLSIIEEYLGWPGLGSGCYYFMAHMNERFDDRKKAMIARYTPLTPEELNDGAFDVDWFKEAYGLLGEERFNRLYDAAKYISDGSKHSRARKYADAALGKVSTAQLETVIKDKRNKDLLMSYGLVPVQGKADLLHRYEFLQLFLKESKQFGAQRRASEGNAVSIALKNMATAAGYADVTRLTLAMESELVKTYSSFYVEHEVDGISLKLSTDEYGKTDILCAKNGKLLKSVPAKLKKEEYYIQLKEVHKKLKEQYSRTVKMFEQSMEERELYLFGELQELCENPVIEPVVHSLVFITEGEPAVHGYITQNGLADCYGVEQPLAKQDKIRICHPADLYQAGCWHDYQKNLFAHAADGKVKKQPFKQIFRELYVKLPEELEKEQSTMFAGNQIQPSKTAACLKTRRWVADYEDGLQKVYYKENLIAHIYALADWFSPSDIEAPALEWVEFTDRKTFRRVKLKDIPDIVYSEVMRDVDLAVSVAHAGGVDPETSHSTIEMRRAVLEFSLPLFKADNVSLEGSHALIQGKRGSYNIHLGSGVIHQAGGHQINVLPVHSQSRGRLFLPFLDEDPKTAEIISKILLFAEDMKIKDPYILEQIVPT